MLTRSTVFCFFIVVLSLLVRLSKQNLNKHPLFPGLGDELDFNFLKTPPYSSFPGGDAGLCHCSGAAPETVHTITYHGIGNQQLVLCMCPNAVMSAQYMIEMMGRVPYAIRRHNRAMISATAGKCGGAGSSGDVSFYCGSNMHISVFIHESAHSTDRGRSASNNWRGAVEQDSCVPDGYANSNYADNFAQVAVLWTHLVGQGHNKDLGGWHFACMRNQLQQIDAALPAWRIQAPRDTLRSGQLLERKEGLTSQNGAYRLVMQDDGNLVLYVSENDVPANALWTTGSFSKGPHQFVVERDGNLIIYDGDHRPSWASNTSRENADQGRLTLQDDGNLVFYDNSNHATWASNTCCFISPRE